MKIYLKANIFILLMVGLILWGGAASVFAGSKKASLLKDANGFTDISTIGPGKQVNLRLDHTIGKWRVEPFGNLSTVGFEVTIDTSFIQETNLCKEDSFEAISVINEASLVRSRRFHDETYRCYRMNLRRADASGFVRVYFLPGGLLK